MIFLSEKCISLKLAHYTNYIPHFTNSSCVVELTSLHIIYQTYVYSFPVFIFPLRMREIDVLSLILFKCWLERKRARWIKYGFVYASCILFTRFLVHVIIFTNNRFLFSLNFLIIFEPKCSLKNFNRNISNHQNRIKFVQSCVCC